MARDTLIEVLELATGLALAFAPIAAVTYWLWNFPA